jgi:hypothetical protein
MIANMRWPLTLQSLTAIASIAYLKLAACCYCDDEICLANFAIVGTLCGWLVGAGAIALLARGHRRLLAWLIVAVWLPASWAAAIAFALYLY